MQRSFRVARGLMWSMGIAAPLLAAAFAWLGYDIVQEHLAGRGWQNPWGLALVLATLAGLVVLFLWSVVHLARARLTVSEEGIEVRGIFRTRAIPWTRLEGYRWIKGKMNVYVVDEHMPFEVGHFELGYNLWATADR